MSDSTGEWGPWIEHDHSGVPGVVWGRYVGVVLNCKCRCVDEDHFPKTSYELNEADRIIWFGGNEFLGRPAVARYRVWRPAALAEMVRLAKNVPKPV